MSGIVLAVIVALTNRFGAVSVDTFGARATSYVPAGGSEVLATLRDGSGGIALCWPWFANDGPKGCRRHGLARYREFAVVGKKETSHGSELVLRLESDDDTRQAFPHDFALTVTFRLGKSLTIEMRGENTGTTPFRVTEMLHPYFRVGSARDCRVRGLEGCRYRDNRQPEFGDGRVWAGEYAVAEGSKVFAFTKAGDHCLDLVDPVLSRVLSFTSSGDVKAVVWSPGEASGGGKNVTSKLAPGEWRTFVCVENGTCYADRAYELKPGERHILVRTIELR